MKDLNNVILKQVGHFGKVTNDQLKRLVLSYYDIKSTSARYVLPLFRAANELCKQGKLIQIDGGYKLVKKAA